MGPGLVVLFSFFLQHLETWNHHSAWFVLLHELNNITIQKTKVRAWCTVRILYIRKWSSSQVHLLILLPFLFLHLKIIFSKNAIFWVEPLLADRATILHKTLSHYVAQGKWNVPPPPPYQINVDNVIFKYSTCLGSSQKNTERRGGGKWGEISFSISDSINYFVSCFSNKFCQRLSFAST